MRVAMGLSLNEINREERAIEFVRNELTEYRLEREVAIRGEIAVSRASAELLEPAHA
jgi:hypothetical protein